MSKILLVLVLAVFSLGVFAQENQAQAQGKKEVNVTASIEIGDNAKELIESGGTAAVKLVERLADTLGMTVKQVFPYYLKQAYLEGLIRLLVFVALEIICVFLLIVLVPLAFSLSKSNKEDGAVTCGVLAVITFVVFLIGLIVGATEGANWIIKMNNPEFRAVQMMVDDAAQFQKENARRRGL